MLLMLLTAMRNRQQRRKSIRHNRSQPRGSIILAAQPMRHTLSTKTYEQKSRGYHLLRVMTRKVSP